MIRVAIDAMGGDFAPREVVHGAVLAASEYSVAIQLVGPEEMVRNEFERPAVAKTASLHEVVTVKLISAKVPALPRITGL